MISRIVLFSGAIAIAALGAGCGSAQSGRPASQGQVVAAFYPVAYAAEQIAGADDRRAEPDARRRRAARSRADAGGRSRRRQGRGTRALSRRRLHARARNCSGERQGARSISSRAASAAWTQEDGSTAPTLTSGSIRCGTRRWPDDRRRARRRRGGRRGWSAGSIGSMPQFRRRPRTLRAAPDRDESRCLRLSRRPLRPRADPARRARRPRRSLRPGASRTSSSSSGDRARRPCSSRRSFHRSSPKTVAREAGVATAVLDPLEGLTGDEHGGRRRLLHGHAGEPRRAAEGSRMHDRDPGGRARRRLVRLPDGRSRPRGRLARGRERASSSRSPARTAVARRPCSASCSGSNAPRPAPCASSGRRARVVRAAPGSATSRSGRT